MVFRDFVLGGSWEVSMEFLVPLADMLSSFLAAELRITVNLFETVIPTNYESSGSADAAADDRATLADRLELIGAQGC